jgi:uncharacterized membrane protein YdbT with pleckstrin-like domain
METIINYYNSILELIPAAYRLPISIIIIIFLVFALVNFFKKNLLWIILFILLLPAAWPAIKQIGFSIYELIQKVPK